MKVDADKSKSFRERSTNVSASANSPGPDLKNGASQLKRITLEQSSDFLQLLVNKKWINPSYRRMAEKKFYVARSNSMPYILAEQKVGEVTLCHDGNIAYEQIWKQVNKTNMFGHDGVAWDSERSRTKFFCIFPGGAEAIPMGSVDDLLEKGLDRSDITALLSVNCFAAEAEPDEDDDPVYEAEWQAVARASFFLLSSSGEILPKDQRAAELVLSPLTEEKKSRAIANVMALSAGSQKLTYLKIALGLGYDPNQRASLVDATPLEHAQNNGNVKAIEILSLLRPR